MIAPRLPVAERPHRIRLQNPAGPPVPDGDGGYLPLDYVDLAPPEAWASIEVATGADLERIGAGTVLAQATYVVTFPHHPGVTTETRILFGAQTFSVTGVANPQQRSVDTVASCTEVVA